jgi:hypothetical protein
VKLRTGSAAAVLMYLSCDKREVASVTATPAAAPVDEPDGVGGVLGDAQGVDKHGGEGGFLEPVGAALAVEPREDEAQRAEVVIPTAAGDVGAVEESAEAGALLRRPLVARHGLEHRHQEAEPHLRRHRRRWGGNWDVEGQTERAICFPKSKKKRKKRR